MNKDKIDAFAEAPEQASARDDVPLDPTIIGKPGTEDPTKTRRDRGRTHVTRHGLLSRDIVRALIRSGESARIVRRHEKQFRVFFWVQGRLGEHIFDRWWSCYLRLVLSARLESNVLTSGHSQRRPPILADLQERTFPTLVSAPDQNEFECAQEIVAEFSRGLFHELALAQRYDGHYSREMNRMLALLLIMRKGGEAAVEKWLSDGLEFTKIQKLGVLI